MKKIYISERQIIENNITEHDLCAGTDTPRFYDEKSDTWYEATWNGDYGFPFGYWPVDYSGYEMMFCVGDAWTTHANACGKAAERYFTDMKSEEIQEDAYNLEDALSNLVSDMREYGYTYNEEFDTYISADGSDEFDFDDKVDEIRDGIYNIDYSYIKELVEYAIENLEYPSASEIEEHEMEAFTEGYDFTTKEGIDEAMESIGSNFYTYFESGRNEGRIWPNNNMIAFYPTEQPDPDTLEGILRDLSQDGDIGVNYEQLLDFFIIFEDGNNNWEVTGCTVLDYMNGDYGPDYYEDDDDEDDEEEAESEIQYARPEKTVFVPHLANQQQKREFFQDFRNTRDRAVYTPRERGAGNLAAYHAMRYPYGEGMETYGDLLLEDKREVQADRHCMEIVNQYFGKGSIDSFRVYKDFKEKFYHGHNIRNTYMMKLAPLFCKLCMEAGFGSVLQDKEIDRIKSVFSNIANALISVQNIDGRPKIVQNPQVLEQLKVLDMNQSLEALEARFGGENEEEKREIKARKNINPQYKILGPLTYEEANKIGSHSYSRLPLCYTQDDGTWESYTNNGENTVYCLLKKDWKKIPEEHDDGTVSDTANAYDRYGLSMIFVFVDPDGKLVYSNSRWNHQGRYITRDVDQAFTKEMIEKIIRVPFDDVFKPTNTFNEELNKIYQICQKDESAWENYFSVWETYGRDLNIIYFYNHDNKKYNFMKGGGVIEDEMGRDVLKIGDILFPYLWFDDVELLCNFGEEINSNIREGKRYFEFAVNKNGTNSGFLWDEVKGQGKLLTYKEHLDIVSEKTDFGSYSVRRKTLNDEYSICMYNHDDGYQTIVRNDNLKPINPYLVSREINYANGLEGVEGILPCIIVDENDMRNLVTPQGEIVFPDGWFLRINGVNGNVISVDTLTENGSEPKLLNVATRKEVKSDEFASLAVEMAKNGNVYLYPLTPSLSAIKLFDMWNLLLDGDEIVYPDTWFKDMVTEYFHQYGFLIVKYMDNTYNMIDRYLDFMLDEPVSMIHAFSRHVKYGGIVQLRNNGLYNYYCLKRKRLLSPTWFNSVSDLDPNNRIIAEAQENIDRSCYLLDTNGRVLNKEPYRNITYAGDIYYIVAIKSNRRGKVNGRVLNIMDENGNVLLKTPVKDIRLMENYPSIAKITALNGKDSYVRLNSNDRNISDAELTKMLKKSIRYSDDGQISYVRNFELLDCHDFTMVVGFNGKYNIITKKGKVLFPNMWLVNRSVASRYGHGIRVIKKANNQVNLLKPNYKLVYPDGWFYRIFYYPTNNCFIAMDRNNNKYTIDNDGNIVNKNKCILDTNSINARLANGENPKDIFDYYHNFGDFAAVALGTKQNYLINNQVISQIWFDKLDYFDKETGLAKVSIRQSRRKTNDEENFIYNFIRKDGTLVSDEWFIRVTQFNRLKCYGLQKTNKKFVILNRYGKFFKQGMEFDNIPDFGGNNVYKYVNVMYNNLEYCAFVDIDELLNQYDILQCVENNNIGFDEAVEMLLNKKVY